MAAIDKFLHFTVDNRGSDLHLKTGTPPLVRIDGELQKLKHDPMSGEQVKNLIYEIMPERNQREYEAVNDTDFTYQLEDLARWRTNAYHDLNGPAVAMRLIPFDIMTVEDLGLPKPIVDLTELPKGIVLCCGPTGCGKSTTLAALLHEVNRRRNDHIITIEDPVEFVHESEECIVSHRQVGTHCESFKRALREALREDPDVILVGEMRDLETTALAIQCAETGHLVFSTVHTTTATSSVNRIIDQFPPDQQEQIRMMLAGTLRAVIAQTLCRRKKKGRVAAFEILYVHSAVANQIREKKTYQLPSIIQTGKKYGMCMMNDSLMDLVKDGIISLQEANYNAVDKQDMNERTNRYLVQQVSSEEMTVAEALKASFFKSGLVNKLREKGFGKALKKVDFSEFDQTDFLGSG